MHAWRLGIYLANVTNYQEPYPTSEQRAKLYWTNYTPKPQGACEITILHLLLLFILAVLWVLLLVQEMEVISTLVWKGCWHCRSHFILHSNREFKLRSLEGRQKGNKHKDTFALDSSRFSLKFCAHVTFFFKSESALFHYSDLCSYVRRSVPVW